MNQQATILAVDDTSESLALLVKLLSAGGYQVRPADSGELALAAVESNPPDLVLLDIRMPGMDGFEVCRRLKAREPTRHVPIILMSAVGDVKEWVAGLHLGAVDFIARPFQPEELLARVATHLALSQARISLDMQAAALRQANEQLQSEIVQRQRIESTLRADSERSERSRRAMLGVLEDQKRINQALAAAEGKFRGLVEQSIAGIYIIQDNKLVYVNPRCAEILGQGPAAELLGSDPLDFIAVADRGKVGKNLQQLIDGEIQNAAMDFGVLRIDGVTIQVGVNGARATHLGRPAIIGLMQDVSEKKRAEEQIKRYVEQLEKAFMSTVNVATTMSELRDPYTAGHERRVGEIAVAIGAELGFDAHRQEGLRVAGYLHDIGKITIPAEMLAKPGKLSAIEYQLIQSHAQASYDVLKDVEFPWPVAAVAWQHHERLDGSGYPQGLKGEQILLEARILAVADVVEAMSSHRPYRPGLGIDKALAEIERGRGTAYDALVADACLKLFREKGFAISA